MLQSLIGEDIYLITRLDAGLGEVMADSGQIHQVLMNLAANARDAMPGGGELTIETAEVLIDESHIRVHPEACKGRCVLMTVHDTGHGIDEEIRPNIFEPFFTTKPPGKGTGLGLATVYGIVHQFNGWIELESGRGQGATFRIYLPRLARESDKESAAEPGSTVAPSVPAAPATILLVEDDENVRDFATAVLGADGYVVITASTGAEAIGLANRHAGVIDLIVTDVVMPGMNGRELTDRLKSTRPGMKVLFISGYTADVIVRRGVSDDAVGFLAKPFSKAILAAKVRKVLSGEYGTSAGKLRLPEKQRSSSGGNG
jgi:CheY-like chemotaxis protein